MDKIDLIIDALESAHHTNDTGVMGLTKSRLDVALAAARELIAQPEQKLIGWKDGEPQYVAQPEQEPKSISTNDHLCAMLRQVHDVLACTALPMKRPWVGLTDDEINKSWEWAQKSSPYGVTRIETFAKSIETKLKERNGAI